MGSITTSLLVPIFGPTQDKQNQEEGEEEERGEEGGAVLPLVCGGRAAGNELPALPGISSRTPGGDETTTTTRLFSRQNVQKTAGACE